MSTSTEPWVAVMQAEDRTEASRDEAQPSPTPFQDTTANGLPVRFVSRHELGEIMRLSVSTIDRMVHSGMPSTTWGRRTRRFDPRLAIAWARDQGVMQ